jgi:uncharacterized protein with PIN domain
MKFIADVMLGSLAKRMRLMGFDVLYDHTLPDNEIIRLALEQDRVILTRDTGLASRPLAKDHLLVTRDDVEDQIRQVIDTFSLSSRDALTRCSVCNEPLEELSKDQTRDRVPEYVYHRIEHFFSCSKCGRTYWKGTHVKNMERKGTIK